MANTGANFNWASYVADYRGLLTFPAYGSFPQVGIPLYIKDHPIPIRPPKTSEITSYPTPETTWGPSTGVVFYGSPDPLTLDLSGWIITPTSVVDSSTIWDPTHNGQKVAAGGISLGLQNWSYGDLINSYLEGSVFSTPVNSQWTPVNPTSYTDPYGRVYTSPLITSFSFNNVRPYKKQTFTLTLWLEPTS